MNRCGVVAWIDGSSREMSIICGVVVDVAVVDKACGGRKLPLSRNGLTLDMVSRAEAEGESRIMGYEREGFDGAVLLPGVPRWPGIGAVALGMPALTCPGILVPVVVDFSRETKSSVCLRTYEKS